MHVNAWRSSTALALQLHAAAGTYGEQCSRQLAQQAHLRVGTRRARAVVRRKCRRTHRRQAQQVRRHKPEQGALGSSNS